MKVMQTLGRHGGDQEGVFQYKRTATGVTIDTSIGAARLPSRIISFTHAEWTAILTTIASAPQESFRLTGNAPFAQPPNQSLYELLTSAVPDPSAGWSWHDSYKAYVCAILEHEGSIDLYHGRLGPAHAAFIALARDT